MAPVVADQEFVVHLFSPLDGPAAADAYLQVRDIWAACRDQLGMTEPIAGHPSGMPPGLRQVPSADGVLAAQQNRAHDRQCVLRRMHDVLNLSVGLAQPAPAPGGPAQPAMSWVDFAAIWSQANRASDLMLGEVQVPLAKMPAGNTGAVAAAADLGESLDALLPPTGDRSRGWWLRGSTTDAGYAVWDTEPAGETGARREVVVVAGSGQEDELSAWAWSDGTADMPPLGRYLLQSVKLRYEAQLLEAWIEQRPGDDTDRVLDELGAALSVDIEDPGRYDLLRSRLSRLRAEDVRLTGLRADLASLKQTVSTVAHNLGHTGSVAGVTAMLEADQKLVQWLTGQIKADLTYVDIQLGRTRQLRTLANEELRRARPDAPDRTAAGSAGVPEAARVFVVHGRDSALARSFFDLLRSVGLMPLEWEMVVKAIGSTAPYLGKVVAHAPTLAQATLVLMTPDDIVELHPDLRQDNDLPHERARSVQARPNVLFELGLALMAYPDRTIIVEIGQMRPIADLAGLNTIRFDGSAVAIKKTLDRLNQAGCPVDLSGADWADVSRFAGLPAYERAPDT